MADFQFLDVRKPDGRPMTLYGLHDIHVDGPIPSPSPTPVDARSQLRWHPVRGEWVAYAAHRQDRTFLPPADFNPLAPTTDPEHPTELPQGRYDMAVFANRFPSLTLSAPDPDPVPGVAARAGVGACEVVVFTQDASASLTDLGDERMALLLRVWADRTERLRLDPRIRHVLPFENRGVEVGVTLHHPHGQIYAYDHVPPVQARAVETLRTHLTQHGRPWLTDFVAEERAAQLRLLRDDGLALSLVPPFARYSYETWVLPTRPAAHLSDLTDDELDALARVLRDALRRLDALFARRMPYLMTVQQAPVNDGEHPEWPLRIEIYPALRAPNKLKYLAGTELGAGVFANDSLPEAKAAELRGVTLEDV
ncbi:galactose-1-phosphate uridylyltransferase [Deinococcus maricopensis]|uniref:Galactose-1-phosphate uridylyltransferase n=1 Tax=Deinococcus maricopensis (strain DSM 21211 / LMG 22137 / NRRL B-23946 / LB-34) TaxID=709986 RepID=E8U7J2_DEIML|nr:galactose-1-phosphate uridylyltransferase [Deinococcus maricopensis]ADV67031.1 galactose-1-phosphate uridylyltransferase [Deinococcus maricopensis DSM 21211]